MNETQNILQDLKDIHYPDPISWWPPAPGWIMLAILAIILSFILIRLIYAAWKKHCRLNKVREDFEKLREQYQKNPQDHRIVSELSIWIKRLLFAFFPREEIASLTGERWLAFLDQVSKSQHFTKGVGRLLLTAPYTPIIPKQTGELFLETERLMKSLFKKKFREQ